jgi:hypothetical protein
MLSARAYADPSIKAHVNSTDITLNDSIMLTIEISGVSSIGSAPTPNIPGFQVQRGGQTQSFQWINGQTSSMIGFNYTLTPVAVGNFTIPPISLNQDGKTYSTDPISIAVRPGDATNQATAGSQAPVQGSQSVDVPSEGLKPVFVTAKIDRTKAFVGEQILLTVQFLRRPSVRFGAQPRYSEPDMTGFLVEPLKQQEYTTTIQGAQYDVTALRYALFPTSDGEFAIGSASVDVAIQGDVDPFDPNSFLQQFFGRTRTLKLTTRAIPVQIRALPKNKPDGFTGAVGRYKISSVIENPDVEPEVGKPLNLIVTVEGVGNVKALKEPRLPEISAFRRYETITNTKVNNDGQFIHGSKEFKILLIPQVSGRVTVPALSYTFYNPDANQFQTESSREISLNVKAGSLSQADQEPGKPIQDGRIAEGVKIVEKDIRFIKSGKVFPMRPALLRRPFFLLFNSLPLLFALGAVITRWRTQVKRTHASHFRSRGALRQAMKTLKHARKLESAPDPVPFYGSLYEAISNYVGDKLGVSSLGLVWEDVDRQLSERSVAADVRAALRDLKEEADMVRFAASEFTTDVRSASLAKATDVLKKLDEALR